MNKIFEKIKENQLAILYMLFAMALITCNCIATKLMILPFKMFGQDVVITSGALVYPLTFLITDIIGERFGKKEAKTAVWIGFLCQVISTLLIIIARYIPCSDPSIQDAYVTLLGQNFMFVLASLSAYLISQPVDVFIFHNIKKKIMKSKKNESKYKWIWNNTATITAQLIDSIVYATVAFGIGFKWLFAKETALALLSMIIMQWIIKTILALLDTPFFYLFTIKSKKGGVKNV